MPREATLTIKGPDGPVCQTVLVIATTPTHYKIQAIARTRIAGFERFLERGQQALAPRRAITFGRSQ